MQPNQFGLYDILGNVSEWTEDYVDRYVGAPTDGSARNACDVRPTLMAGMLFYRTHRGGDFGDSPFRLRSAARGADDTADWRFSNLGFRLAKT